ncbi:HlyD family efflux transporter periplasmic adaptor subunit [Microcoleus sp. Pol10_D6]|uniref:HlyD family efflux transporter periplasmic adaptor subunit n=1 Tax=Microcoleus sp. Pol10_D6 TaxID=2818875 RepID=UPI002FD0376E
MVKPLISSVVFNPSLSKAKRWLFISGLVAVTAVVGLVLTVRHFQVSAVPKKIEAPAPLSTVSAIGRLEPLGEIVHVAASAGTAGARLEKLLVKTGERVRAGQVMAVLDLEAKYQVAVEQALSRVRIADAKLTKVRAGAKQGEIQAQAAQVEQLQIERVNQITAQQSKINRIRADLQGEVAAQQATVERGDAEYRNAKMDSGRFEQLYNDGAISASQYDSAKLKAETAQLQWAEAKAVLHKIHASRQAEIAEAQAILERIQAGQSKQINSAQANLAQIAEVRPVDIEIAQAEIAEAQANLRQAQVVRETAYIRAPQAGQVLKIHTRAGETIRSMGENLGILDLGQTQQMVAVAEVYDSDVVKVRPGQRVTVRATSIHETLQGTVTEIGHTVQRQNVINTDPTANIDARIVEVRVQLDPESSQKVVNLTNLQVEMSIQLEQERVQ